MEVKSKDAYLHVQPPSFDVPPLKVTVEAMLEEKPKDAELPRGSKDNIEERLKLMLGGLVLKKLLSRREINVVNSTTQKYPDHIFSPNQLSQQFQFHAPRSRSIAYSGGGIKA